METLGDHIRAKRLDLGMRQCDVAEQVGVDAGTVWNWEKNKSSPDLRMVPRVLEFLGCEPESLAPRDQGEALVMYRRTRGMSQEEMAQALGVDPGTLGRWEKGEARMVSTVLDRIRRTDVWFEGLGQILEPGA